MTIFHLRFVSFFVCSLCVFPFYSSLPLSSPAVHQCLALACPSLWRWRRTIVVAVTSWPYADTSWTGTSSRFTLSTLPATMLWVIWQLANKQPEVFELYFLNNTKGGLCGGGWGNSIREFFLFVYPFCFLILMYITVCPFLGTCAHKANAALKSTKSAWWFSLFCSFGHHLYLFWSHFIYQFSCWDRDR